MDQYRIFGRIGEGAHGVVIKAKHIETGELVALKKVPLRILTEGIPNTAIREIKALQFIESCPYVVKLREMFPYETGFVLVFDYMVTDLSEVIRNLEYPLTESQSKSYMSMLLCGVEDLKPANLLISSDGILKIADFGLARVFDNNDGERQYSHQVATRWYRAPELLYGAKNYTNSVDLWAIGCIFGELLNRSPLFPGGNDIEQLWFVVRVLGPPNETVWPEIVKLPDYNKITFNLCNTIPFEEILPDASVESVDLIKRFLIYPPYKRISVSEALRHSYFLTDPLPARNDEMPIKHVLTKANPGHYQQNYESSLLDSLDTILINHGALTDGSKLFN